MIPSLATTRALSAEADSADQGRSGGQPLPATNETTRTRNSRPDVPPVGATDLVIDLFAGMGGWSEGALALDVRDIGIEMDPAACRTRVAAGHATICADVSTFPLKPLVGRVRGIIASPPCTDWSQSGKRQGLDGPTGALVLEVDRWVRALEPEWVACEQVPPAVEWWHRFAREWRELGYSTWAGVLNSADYGVPQTRKRAILIASRTRRAALPEPTHAKSPEHNLFAPPLERWISMADALGWGEFDAVYQRGAGMIERHGERPPRPAEAPAPTLTGSALGAGAGAKLKLRLRSNNSVAGVGRAERDIEEPAFTVTSRADLWTLHTNRGQDEHGNRQEVPSSAPAPALSTKAGGQWWWTAPSTTLGGDPRVSPRCHHETGMQGRDALAAAAAAAAAGEGTGFEPIRLTLRDALILQSFRPDYPVTGNKGKQFEQVGNAVPPLLARHVLAAVVA